MSLVIHEQQQRKMQPFYWILTFEMLTFGMLLGIVLAVGPFVLLSLWPSGWMWLTLLAIPVGIIIFIKCFHSLKERIWHNRHVDHYALYEDRIEYTIWNHETKEAEQGSLPIRDIKEMYYGRHLQQYSYAYKKTSMTENAPMYELLPVLHLIHNNGWQDKLLTVPFVEMMDANRWLEVISPRGIPLWLSSVVIHDPGDESVGLLRKDEYKAPAEFDGNIERQFRPYLDKQIADEEERDPTEEELAQIDAEIKQLDYIEAERKKKSTFGNMGLLAWLVFPLQYGLGRWIFNEAVTGKIDPEGMLYPMTMITITSVVFFLLVKRMRWLQMIVFQVVSIISMAFIDLEFSENENDPAYQISSALIGAAMLNTALIWVLYLIIKFLRRGRDEDDRKPIPAEPHYGLEGERPQSESADQLKM